MRGQQKTASLIQLNPDRSRDQTSGAAILNESKAVVNKGVKEHVTPAEAVQRFP